MSTPTKSPPKRPTISTTLRPHTTKRVAKSTTPPLRSNESLNPEAIKLKSKNEYSYSRQREEKPISPICNAVGEDEDDLCGDEVGDDEMRKNQKSKKSRRRRSRAKGTASASKAMEYGIDEMFPNMKLLLKKRKDWDFKDPDYIRAAYVESETGIMMKWKSENARIKSVKNDSIQFKSNLSNDLKMRHLLRKIEKERREKRKLSQILKNYLYPPQFPPVQIYTNATTQLRNSYIHNNPVVPAFVVQHFSKFKKPPFKTTKKEPYKVTRCG